MTNRTVLSITGADREGFLQGLISNDVTKARDGIIYAALLTPQGKYLADFFVIGQADRFLIDVDSGLAAGLAQRLSMYRLRADAAIAESGLTVSCGTGPTPDGALTDPRDPAMGGPLSGPKKLGGEPPDWVALRVAHLIPETGRELSADSYILECGFERLRGVDFRKGCYVGQEVTARMKHKTELRKGLARVRLERSVVEGTPIMAGDKEIGTVHTVAETRDGVAAIAYLRFDQAKGDLTAGGVGVTLV